MQPRSLRMIMRLPGLLRQAAAQAQPLAASVGDSPSRLTERLHQVDQALQGRGRPQTTQRSKPPSGTSSIGRLLIVTFSCSLICGRMTIDAEVRLAVGAQGRAA